MKPQVAQAFQPVPVALPDIFFQGDIFRVLDNLVRNAIEEVKKVKRENQKPDL